MRAAAFLPVLTLVAGCDDSNPVSAIPQAADGPILTGEGVAPPEVVIHWVCGRFQGNGPHVFFVEVRHEHYARSQLEYRFRLRALGFCEGPPPDENWTAWVTVPEFTEGPFPVSVAIHRLSPGCHATFTLQVRTPQGRTAENACEIERM